MDPNFNELYAGLSGFVLVPPRTDLGAGVVLSQTYAHFMAPFLMAFKPAARGMPHPPPWKAAKGGFNIDITAELFVPIECQFAHLDRLNTIWWILALLRLKAASSAFVPVVSSEKFSSISSIEQEPYLWPIETQRVRLVPDGAANAKVDVAELDWLSRHWQTAMGLLANEDFSFAFRAVDATIWNSDPALALVGLWGALERLFSTSTQELSFRVSANIAAFLERPGRERLKCFKQVKSLYDHRSRAAHGEGIRNLTPYGETYAVARRALLAMIETNRVPSKKDFENLIFGDLPFPSTSEQAN